MIGRECNPYIRKTNLVPEIGEEIGELTVESERHGLHFGSIRTNGMTEHIVWRQADDQKIGRRSAS